MSSLRKLERSVIMHKSYELCGSSAMFHSLWNKYHYKGGIKTNQSNVNSKRQPKKDKNILGKIKKRLKCLFGKKDITAIAASN